MIQFILILIFTIGLAFTLNFFDHETTPRITIEYEDLVNRHVY